MVKILSLILLVFCAIYVNGLPSENRVKRGFNNNGYGDARGGDGYYNQGSDEQDASVSREHGEHCSSGESDDSRELGYGRNGYTKHNNQHENYPGPR